MRVIAHRGSSFDHPENTVAAFRAAVAHGAHGVELDVRLTADGRLAVIHDPSLPDGRDVASLRADQLPEALVLLDAALDACGDLEVNIELKNIPLEPGYDESARIVEVVADLLDGRSASPPILVSTFDPHTLNRVRDVAPHLPTGFLLMHGGLVDFAIDLATGGGHRALHPWDVLVGAELVRRCHDHGLAVNVWTVNEPDRIRELAEMGVDGVITDRPDLALDALTRG